nr:putative integron gene cassette protein [uncultured bacterium]
MERIVRRGAMSSSFCRISRRSHFQYKRSTQRHDILLPFHGRLKLHPAISRVFNAAEWLAIAASHVRDHISVRDLLV